MQTNKKTTTLSKGFFKQAVSQVTDDEDEEKEEGVKAPSSPPPFFQPPPSLLRANGFIYLTQEFSQEKIIPIVAQIQEYNLMDDDDRPEMITLVINSPGGNLHSCMHLIDTINLSEIPVQTIGQGLVASAGIFTLMSGHKGMRYVTTNTSVMSHQYSGGYSGKEHELSSKMKDLAITSERVLNHYKYFTGKSESYIRKNLLCDSDVYLTPEDCLRHGIVDTVVNTYTLETMTLKDLRALDKAAKLK